MEKEEWVFTSESTEVEYPDGFTVRLPAKLIARDEPRLGFTTTIEYVYAPYGPRVRAVSVISNIGTVNGETLRQVRVQELGRINLHALVSRHGHPAIPPASEITKQVDAGVKSLGTLALVQTVYMYAELAGIPPAKHVQEVLGLTAATAGRWIRKSKESLNWSSIQDAQLQEEYDVNYQQWLESGAE